MMGALCRPADVEVFRDLVARRLGLQFDDSKLAELADLLERRLSFAKEPSSSYLSRLDDPGAQPEELRILAHLLTVHETYFFRNAEQFRAFSEVALPDRIRANASSRRLRILSAGCASGEEPYSMAMLILDHPDLIQWDVSVRGADISVAMLDNAVEGRYSTWSLRETPAETRSRFFKPDGRDYLLDPAIKRLVTLEEHNLAASESALLKPEAFDIVFCRNVIMYFTPETARKTVARLSRSLSPGGFLFLGHAETLRGLSHDFHLRQSHGTFYYQRRESASPQPRPGESVPAGRKAELEGSLEGHLPDDSWVEIIRKASERIRSLADAPPSSNRPGPGTLSRNPARAVHNLGSVLDLLQRERFSEANALLGALPAEAKGDPDVLLLRAVLLTHGGDLAQAERLSLELLAQDELSAGAHYILALCRENAGDREGARDHDLAALYLDPAFAMPRLHLGLLARRSGALERARHELQEALDLLQREDVSRVLMFGGGFNRDALLALCRAELSSCGGPA